MDLGERAAAAEVGVVRGAPGVREATAVPRRAVDPLVGSDDRRSRRVEEGVVAGGVGPRLVGVHQASIGEERAEIGRGDGSAAVGHPSTNVSRAAECEATGRFLERSEKRSRMIFGIWARIFDPSAVNSRLHNVIILHKGHHRACGEGLPPPPASESTCLPPRRRWHPVARRGAPPSRRPSNPTSKAGTPPPGPATAAEGCSGATRNRPSSVANAAPGTTPTTAATGAARLGSPTLTSVLGWASFHPRYSAHRHVRGPCSTPPARESLPNVFNPNHFRGLFTWIAFSTLLASSLTDALLRSDSAPKFACAQEGRWSATPEPFATPAG